MKKNKGVSLVEMLMVIGTISLVAMLLVTLVTMSVKQLRVSRTFSARDQLVSRVERVITDRFSIAESITAANITLSGGNQNLGYCVNGATAGCTGFPNCCTAGTQEFMLYNPALPGVRIGGTSASPAYYDEVGDSCPGPNCILQIITSYRATCPGLAATCSKADRIDMHYILEPTPFMTGGNTDLPGMKAHSSTVVADSVDALGGYHSADCTDWATKGWPSFDDCMKDGRKHKAYALNAAGAIVLGTKADLKAHV